MNTVETINEHSTCVTLRSMKARSGMSDRDNGLFEKKIIICLAEYNGLVFEKDYVNNTVMNDLGKTELPT
mgnify:CR=1 FL=1